EDAFHADVRRGCDQAAPLGSPSRVKCTWVRRGARGTVVLIGDSNAGHFTEPVVSAANSLGLTATVATMSSCPFLHIGFAAPRADTEQCERFVRASLRWLVAHPPRLVIIGSRADTWIEDPQHRLSSFGGPWTDTPSTKAAAWEEGLRSEIQSLNHVG